MKRGGKTKKKSETNHHPLLRIQRTLGQKAADALTKWAGSWFFITLLILMVSSWILLNEISQNINFDPRPYIMLNLILNIITVILSPIILMSQNRETHRERIKAEYDYRINKKAEEEIREIKQMLMKKR